MQPIQIRVLIFRDSERWCAQCIEYDVAVEATSLTEIETRLLRLLSDYLDLAREQGHAPFIGIPPAPPQFERMYNESDHKERIVNWLESAEVPGIVPTVRYLEVQFA